MWCNHYIVRPFLKYNRILLALLSAGLLSSCVMTRTVRPDALSLDMVITPHEWRIQHAEKPRRQNWVEKAVARVTGPPAVVSGLVVEYWMTHDKTWPTSYEQLDLDKIGLRSVLRRVKSVTITPVDRNTAILEMLYDSNIPARVKLNVELAEASTSS